MGDFEKGRPRSDRDASGGTSVHEDLRPSAPPGAAVTSEMGFVKVDTTTGVP